MFDLAACAAASAAASSALRAVDAAAASILDVVNPIVVVVVGPIALRFERENGVMVEIYLDVVFFFTILLMSLFYNIGQTGLFHCSIGVDYVLSVVTVVT